MKDKKEVSLTKEEIISLTSIYLNEWEHRDDILWQHVFNFYYVTLIVMVFPHITGHFDTDIKINEPTIFYYIGLIMSTMFYYIAIAVAMRAKTSYKAYKKLADLLEDGKGTYSRESVASLKFGKVFNLSLAILKMINGK